MTRLLVLGLLDEGPMSGYALQQKLQGADAERWGGVLTGSIYHALKKLEEEGQIALAGVEHTGHRQKAVYRITEQGRGYLRRLLLDALRVPDVPYPTTLYSGLSLLDKVPQAEARRALEERQRLLEEELAGLERGERSNEGRQVPAISRLTIGHMFATIRLQMDFVAGLLAALEQEEEP